MQTHTTKCALAVARVVAGRFWGCLSVFYPLWSKWECGEGSIIHKSWQSSKGQPCPALTAPAESPQGFALGLRGSQRAVGGPTGTCGIRESQNPRVIEVGKAL